MKRLHLRKAVGAVLLVLLLAFTFEVGREIRGSQFKADLQQQLCVKTLDEMPDEVPQRLFLNITDGWNRTLEGEPARVVTSSLEDALAVFSFSDRLLPRFEPIRGEVTDGDHVMRLVVELGRRLELMKLSGTHCSTHVFVSYTSDVHAFTLRLIHELGHFLGLYHEWEDATYMGYASCLGPFEERFNQKQMEILDEWNSPGTNYTPHWVRREPGPCPVHKNTVYGIPVLYTTMAAVAVSFAVVVYLWRKGGSRSS